MTRGKASEWSIRPLGELLAYEQPGRYLVRSSNYAERGRYPVLTAGKTFILGYTNETDGVYLEHPVIIFDDFTTASKYVDFDFKAKSSAMKMLRARPGQADLRFVYERMQLMKFQISDHKRRWISEYRKLEIGAPALAEQEVIGEVIDDLTAYLAALERSIAKKQAIKRGMLQQLLAGKTRLSGFTAPWSTRTLGTLGTFLKGRGVKRDNVRSSGVPCIRYGELYTAFHDYTAEVKSFVSADVAATALPLRKGDLMFAGSGETREEIGKCVAYVGPMPAVAGGDVIVLRGEDYNSIYLALLANTPEVVSQKARAGQGDAVVHIYSQHLAAIEVTLPPRDEQDAIAQAVVHVDSEVSVLRRRLRKARNVKQGMMQELLTGRTRLPFAEAVT